MNKIPAEIQAGRSILPEIYILFIVQCLE